MNQVMQLQHRLKRRLKPLLFRDRREPRAVKSGPARGVRLLVNRRTGLQVEFGLWETELHGIYRRHVLPGTLAWDVGAADGYTALLYAALGARVVAYEPDVDALRLLDGNLALNPELAGRIEVVRGVYAPRPGDAAPDFVKVDVDGAELEVIRGLPRAAAVVVETHSLELEAESERLLREAGYETRVVRNARWRRLYPEYRPLEHNRWLLATSAPSTDSRVEGRV